MIISGGRDFDDVDAVAGWLIKYEYSPDWASPDEKVFPQIVHGGCNMIDLGDGKVGYRDPIPKGADAIADFLARRWRWPDPEIHWARWEDFGPYGTRARNRAGPARNHEMALAGADICCLFPGGRGTANMKRCALAAGIPVVDVPIDDHLRSRGRKYVNRHR